jgi:S-adenosyl methyltransferase
MELVEPGLVPIARWRPDTDDAPWIDAHGAVARKP